MVDRSAQPPRAASRSYARGERIGFGVLMVIAPLAMLVAAFLHPPHGIEDGTEYYHAAHDFTTRFYVSHTMFFLAGVLFIPTVVGLARLVHPTHPKAAFWGCILALMGFMGYGAMAGMDYMTWVAGNPDTGLDPDTTQQYVDAALASNAILIPTLVVFFLLPAGLIVLAVGLHRAKVLNFWLAIMMPVGMTGMALFLEFRVPLVLSAVLLLISFGWVGLKLLRTQDSAVSGPGPV